MRMMTLALATCGLVLGSVSQTSASGYAPKSGKDILTSPCRRSLIARPSPVGLPRQEGAADPVRLVVSGLPITCRSGTKRLASG